MPGKVPPGPVPVNPAVRHTPVLAHSFPPCSGGSARSGGRTPTGRNRGRKESLFPEPLFGGFRPLIRGMSAFFHAIPVASRGIEVQTGGNPLFPASLFHQPAVGAGNAVIQSVDEEHRRRLLRHLSLRGTHLLQGRGWMSPQYFVARSPVGSMGRHGNDGINKHGKSGRAEMFFSGFSASSGRVRFHSVEAMAARWPPAEKPMTPMRRGSIPREEAFFRTILRAWRASSRGPGNFPRALLVPETRYFTTTPTMPCSAAQPAMRLPSFQWPGWHTPLPEKYTGPCACPADSIRRESEAGFALPLRP